MAKILVVDDEKSVLEMLRYALEAQGYMVITAETGAMALSWLKETRLDLAIIDLGLPDMNGLEICTSIKENPKTRSLPIMILTGNSTNEAKIKGSLEASSDLFLNKPIEIADLKKAVAVMLENAGKKKLLLRNTFKHRLA
jgi:two-component system alkaline phosphatase synthesis response regulator PhoP